MTLALPVPEIDPAVTDLDQARAFAAERGRVLRELTGIGMKLARALAQQVEDMMAPGEDAIQAATAPRTRPLSVDPGLAFSRIARAVRLTVALEARHDEEMLTLGEKLQSARIEDALRRRREAQSHVNARKYKIRRILEDQIEAMAGEDADEDEVEDQVAELYERTEEACEAEDFMDRPFEDLIAAIQKDLGLSPTSSAEPLAARQKSDPRDAANDHSEIRAPYPDLTAAEVAEAWRALNERERTGVRKTSPGGSG